MIQSSEELLGGLTSLPACGLCVSGLVGEVVVGGGQHQRQRGMARRAAAETRIHMNLHHSNHEIKTML